MIELLRDVSLKPYNTFGIEVKTDYFVEINQTVAYIQMLSKPEIQGKHQLIIGGGSNLLLTHDFDGVVIKNNIKGITVVNQDSEHIWVKVGAGENWHEFVLHCIENGWGGVENLSLIPGTVGATPIQNIGAYGVEIKDVLELVEFVNPKTGEINYFTQADCKLAYRDSIFKHKLKGKAFITHVTYKLTKHNHRFNLSYGDIKRVLAEKNIEKPTLKAISDAVISIRQSKLPDPAVIGNCGSFFKNPEITAKRFERMKSIFPDIVGFELPDHSVKVAAGWLIEQCGWKGKTVKNAGVHDKQALVIVNKGGATGEEIKQLALEIKRSVEEKFGIALETEVNIV
jgi:UDP-N-acetylmuramate dehydrogenase